MRGFIRERLPEDAPRTPEQEAREALLANYGAKAAAWLLWQRRRALRGGRAVAYHLPAGRPAPMWFGVAMDFLRRRRGWEVRKSEKFGRATRWTIRWLGREPRS